METEFDTFDDGFDDEEFDFDDSEFEVQTLELKREISDDDLRECLAELKQMADNAGIPEEPYEADFGAVLKGMVDDLLQGTDF